MKTLVFCLACMFSVLSETASLAHEPVSASDSKKS